MKFFVRIQPSVEGGNKLIKDPKGFQKLEAYFKRIHGEAAYFYEQDGLRTFEFIVEMPTVDKLPSIAEPMFQQYNAKVELHPVMLFDDVKKGLAKKK
ncbi:MAG: hypothetical protein P8X83_01955 [Nitrosopumilaceae archaeon]